MTISSINTNLAALYAQQNIGVATQNTSNDVSALSSGNRIVNASTDVAALAAGTGLQSEVNTLNTALSNASQGTSLLQVADGALSQIQSILQRQQAITTSAQSGSLSSTQLGFLDQEFQALTSEIDQLATTTNFNGVNLIDGSLSGSNPLESANAGSGASAATVGGFTATGAVTAFTSFDSNGTNNDTTFYGNLSQGTFTVKSDATTAAGYDVAYSINGSTYSGYALNTATSIALTNGNATITLGLTGTEGAATTASNVTALQSNLASSFAGATAYAIHQVATTDVTSPTGQIIANSSIAAAATAGGTYGGTDNTAGTLLAGFTGAAVKIQSAGFNGVNIPSISNLTASTTGGALSGLSITVNGQTYSTAVAAKGTGNGISTETFGGGTAGSAVFYLNGDTSSKEQITFNFATITADSTNVQTADGVAAFTAAVNNVLGSGGSGLTFQVGSTASQNIGITLGNATSSSLFGNVPQNVLTQASAATAATAVNTALNTITALRATVGADEERFNFASSAIQSGAQNEQAAQSNLLDTNVASTSTQFATNQVQLQAGIAVLAQANQLSQNLLKLLP